MEITRISSRKISDEMAQQIKEQIMSGKILPGDKLPSTRELSERYQVGRSTVREALSALKAMGLLDIYQGEGCYVRGFDVADVEIPQLNKLLMSKDTLLELIEARKLLEVSMAGLAAQKRNAEDLRDFEAILIQMQEHLGDEVKGEKADISFHLRVAQATHNSIMMRMLETISTTMEVAIRETRRIQMYANASIAQQLYNEHHQIYLAIQAGQPELAQNTMKQHLRHVEQVLMKFLQYKE
jgi:GntR family transcriptional repressor for pyruvate dehydrogenase complex